MEALIGLVAQHGIAIVFANVLLEQIGLPLPAIPTLIIAGALAVDGHLSPLTLFVAAFVACTIGDTLWYLAGRHYGNRVMRLLCRVSLSPDSCVRQTEYHFERWGGLALVFAKFIPGLSTIAPPLAGATRLGWALFLLWNSIGIAIWAGAAIGAGMLFHAQIEGLIGRLEDYGAFAIGAMVVLLAGYVALKWWERRRFYNMLRVARITADELHRLKQGGENPVVVDVRSASSRQLDPRFVPGALAMDVADVDRRLNDLPQDREIIFYCNCPNEASAAQVAKKLIELGYTRVRPLHGGLDAWVAAGLEVERRATV